jgi:hypothetical protein
MKKVLIGKGLIEIVIIFIVLVLIASLIIPTSIVVSRAKVRRTTCTSNLRHIAIAATMYAQDYNNKLLGLNDKKSKKYIGWVKNVQPYIRGGYDVNTPIELFYCPETKSKGDVHHVSYGYNAALLKTNGMGIDVGMINHPEKTGIVCDAEPMQDEGGLIGGADITVIGIKASKLMVKPVSRHPITKGNKVTIIGYVDGHASSVIGKYNENDKENGVNKAFYRAVELGYIKKTGTKGRSL